MILGKSNLWPVGTPLTFAASGKITFSIFADSLWNTRLMSGFQQFSIKNDRGFEKFQKILQ